MADKNEDGKVEKKEFARLRNYDDEMYKKFKNQANLRRCFLEEFKL